MHAGAVADEDVLRSKPGERAPTIDITAFPADDVDTIGGWIWHHLGRTPEPGDVVHPTPDHPAVRVDEMDGRAVVRASFDEPRSRA